MPKHISRKTMEKWKITVASKKLKQDLESVIAIYTT